MPIYIPEPLEHQRAVDESAARFKLLHHGRRWGKDRVAFKGAIAGHGPGWPDDPMFPGTAHGWWIGWVVRDFTQGLGIWREEFLPRFEPWKPTIQVSKSELRVGLPNNGGLFMCTAENIASIRGLGKRIKGVVINEAAHFDLETAWTAVLRALLVDNQGWAIIMSTPNSGDDGNPSRTLPSYFNRLCLAVKGGEMGPEWDVFGGDVRDNPVMKPEEAVSFLRDLGEGSIRQQEEGYGVLLQTGAGLAFPEWDQSLHVQALEPDEGCVCAGGMDWGHGTPGWFGLVYTLPDGRLLLRHELYFQRTRAKKIGYQVGKLCLRAITTPEIIALDSACFSTTGVGATIAEKIQEGIDLAYARADRRDGPIVDKAPKGPDAIRTQKTLLHEVLGFERDRDGVLVEIPQLVVHPDCRDFCRTMAKLPLDPADPNRFDTKAEDHPPQGFAYLLGYRAPDYKAPAVSREIREARSKLDQTSRREAESFDGLAVKLRKVTHRS